MGFNFGGLFSSESKSSSSSSATSNTDSRMVNDGGAIGLNSANSTNSTVNIYSQSVDGGAMDFASKVLDLGNNSLAAAGISTANAIDMAGGVANNAMAANGITSYEAMLGMGLVSEYAMDKNSALAKSVAEAGQSMVNSTLGMVNSQAARNSSDFASILGATTALAQSAYGAMNSNISLARDLNSASMSAYESASQQASGNKNIVLAGMAVVALAVVMMWGNK